MKKKRTNNPFNSKSKKLAPILESDLAEYKELMDYYYSTENIPYELNTTEANYQEVTEVAAQLKKNKRITTRFLCDLYNGYDLARNRSIKTFSDILAFLREYKIDKSGGDVTDTLPLFIYDEVDVKKETDELQRLYDQDEIDIGVVKANKAYDKYFIHPQILKHIFRFNMRKKEWERIRDIVEKVLKVNPTEKIQTQCYLALFECELREANSIFLSERTERIKKILYAKKILNKVPSTQHHYGEYLYWHGKWFLELWHCSNGDDISHLKQAQSYFEKALKEKKTFWYHAYKCITLKLLNNKSFSDEVQKFTEYIIKEKDRLPNRPSVRTYRITSFVLNDDKEGLANFLKEHNGISSAIDFQSTAFHHIELIYFYETENLYYYKTALKDWIANLPVK